MGGKHSKPKKVRADKKKKGKSKNQSNQQDDTLYYSIDPTDSLPAGAANIQDTYLKTAGSDANKTKQHANIYDSPRPAASLPPGVLDTYLKPVDYMGNKSEKVKNQPGGSTLYESLVAEGEPSTQYTYLKPKPKTYKLVVAIDFGTTHCGYCYAYIEKEHGPDIHVNPNWVGEGATQYKTPSSICLKNGKFHSMGFKAENDYNESVNSTDLQLFINFKMGLHAHKKLDRNTETESLTGYKMKTMDICAMAIRYMKEHCLRIINDANRLPEANKILWVLTVPAIWEDPQKLFMREAAIQAGLITDINDDSLQIALEPESASVYCRSLSLNDDRSSTPLSDKSCFMVIDAGGGTIDITCYECLANGASNEIHKATGGKWGGILVNKQFEILLTQTIFGEEFVNHCKDQNGPVYFDLLRNFEQAKLQYKPGSATSITINMAFADYFEEFNGTKLKLYFQNKPVHGITITNNGHLQLSSEIMKTLFDPAINEILCHLDELFSLACIKKTKVVFLVGGFSQCIYLQTEIRQYFKKKDIKVIIPEAPVLSVVKGAVMYGCNPKLINSRISPRTYSCSAYKGKNNEIMYLCKVIDKGQSVEHGHVETRYYEPAQSHMTNVHMELYASDAEFSSNPNDPRNYQIGEVDVPCVMSDSKRLVEFTFVFGGTEIKIQGKDMESLIVGKTTISCLNPGNSIVS